MVDGKERRARRGSRACVPPLALVSVAFFLPFVRSCPGDPVPVSPLSAGLTDVVMTALVWPLFLIAAGLALATLFQPGAGPSRLSARGVLAAPILTWLASVYPLAFAVPAVLWHREHMNAADLSYLAFQLLIALPLSIVAFRRALRSDGWIRWRYVLASFAAAAYLTFPVEYVFVNLADLIPSMLPGALVLALGMSWLTAAGAWAGLRD
jgi:hypothetical protein